MTSGRREIPIDMTADPEPEATVIAGASSEQRALGINESVEYPAVDVEMGESVEIVVEGGRIEAFLSDNVFVLDPKLPDARFALRAYAYALYRRGAKEEARSMLREIGDEG